MEETKEESSGLAGGLHCPYKGLLPASATHKSKITNDTFCDYYASIEAFEADVQKYKTVPVAEWDWKSIYGYYDKLIRDKAFSTGVLDGEFSYDYIANQSGGFYGAWIFQKHPVTFGELAFYPYIQLEFKEGSINICARLSIEKYGNGFTATDLKNCIAYNNKTEWAYNLEQFGFYKPNRISPGKTMTVGNLR